MTAKIKRALAFVNEAARYEGESCLPWLYPINYWPPYPSVRINGKTRRANRLVCELAHGSPPPGKTEVAHSCGNTKCVAPTHLRWATHAENMADKRKHGTAPRGTEVNTAKLTESDVLAIRTEQRKRSGELAVIYGVSQRHIRSIRARRAWAWVP